MCKGGAPAGALGPGLADRAGEAPRGVKPEVCNGRGPAGDGGCWFMLAVTGGVPGKRGPKGLEWE